jgi:hypothetical protein
MDRRPRCDRAFEMGDRKLSGQVRAGTGRKLRAGRSQTSTCRMAAPSLQRSLPEASEWHAGEGFPEAAVSVKRPDVWTPHPSA